MSLLQRLAQNKSGTIESPITPRKEETRPSGSVLGVLGSIAKNTLARSAGFALAGPIGSFVAPRIAERFSTDVPQQLAAATRDVAQDVAQRPGNALRELSENIKTGTVRVVGAAQTQAGVVSRTLGQGLTIAAQLGAARTDFRPDREAAQRQREEEFRAGFEASERVGSSLIEAGMENIELADFVDATRERPELNPTTQFLAQGIGQGIPSLVGAIGVALPATLIGGPIAGGAAGASVGFGIEGGFAYSDARRHGADERTATSVAYAVGGINGLLETLPVTRLIQRTGAATEIRRRVLREISRNVVRQATEEGSTESLQQVVSNAFAKVYDEERSLFEGVPESAFFGALLGGGAGGASTAAGVAVGDVQRLTPEERQAGFARIPGQGFDMSRYRPASRKTAEAFEESTGQKEIPTRISAEIGPIEIGSFGREAIDRKIESRDRFPASEISSTLDEAFLAIPASRHPGNYRFDNIVFLSRDEDGLRAVYTRENKNGALEVINAHRIPDENIRKYFEDIGFGIPTGTRTRMSSLENSQFIQLAYGDVINLSEQLRLVKQYGGRLITDSADSLLKQAESIDRPATPNQTRRAIREQTEVGDVEVRTTQRRLLRDRLRISRSVARSASIASRRQISRVQEEITSVIQDSDISRDRKARLLATVKNIQTKEQLVRQLPEIEARIRRASNIERKRELINAIKDDLKRTKPKTQNGKLRGRFTPEAERILAPLRDVLKLTVKEAKERLEKNNIQYADSIPPVEISIQNQILAIISDYRGVDVEKIENVANAIAQIVEEGEVVAALRLFNRQAQIQADRDFVLGRLSELPEGFETVGNQKTAKERMKQFAKSIGHQLVFDWGGLMRTLDWNASVRDKQMHRRFSVLDSENTYKELQSRFVEDLKRTVLSAYDIEASNQFTTQWKSAAQIRKLQEEVYIGSFKNADGVFVDLRMTRDEAIKRYMETLDPSLRESLIQGNKYTDEIIDALGAFLSKNDKRYARMQLQMYQHHYDEVNEVYSRIYGVDLPFNEFYSPVSRVGYQVDPNKVFGQLHEDVQARSAVSPGALKKRVESLKPLELRGSTEVLMNHFIETNSFIAWADQIQLLQGVFSDSEIRQRVKNDFGSSFLRSIDEHISDMTHMGNKDVRRFNAVDWFRTHFTIGALAIKPAITVKQYVSTIAYLEDLGPVEFTAGVVDFWKNPIKNARTLNNESVFMRERGSNIERDIAAAMKSDSFQKFKSKKSSIVNIIMMNVAIGDKGAILTGAWAMRRAALKKGETVENAIRQYEEFSSETQQSSDVSRLSRVQRGSTLEKAFTMFLSSPRAYYQKEVNAVATLFQKDGITPQNIRRVSKVLFIYHVLLPVAFQFIANFGRTDDEAKKDYLRAGLLGSINGLFIFGQIADAIIRAALGMRVYDPQVPILSVGDDLVKAVQKLRVDDITPEDFQEAMMLFSEASNSFGLPADQAMMIYAGAQKVMQGNFRDGIGNILGWSDYAMGETLSSEEQLARGLQGRQAEIRDETHRIALEKLEEFDRILAEQGEEAANEAFLAFDAKHPTIGDAVIAARKQRDVELTNLDRQIQRLNIDNYFRAHFIHNILSQMETSDEKNAYIEELDAKGLITDKVFDQLKELKEEAERFGEMEAGRVYEEKNIIKRILQYAQAEDVSGEGLALGAFQVDPITAFQRIFQGETLNYVDAENGRIVVNRMPATGPGSSQWQRRESGVTPENKDELRLEHLVPLSLGGTNQEKNLRLVTFEDWEKFTRMDNLLLKAVRNKKVSLKEAQKLIKNFKDGKKSEEEIRKLVGD